MNRLIIKYERKVHKMEGQIPIDFYAMVLEFEREGLVTRTFRRLDPEREGAVIQAILAEAAETGVTDLNIKKVAERAGVSIGSLYQYFGSRQKLLDFAIALVVQTNVAALASTQPYFKEMTVMQALSIYLSEGINWSQQEAGFTRFFASAAYHGDPELGERVVRPVATVLLDLIRGMVFQAAERGEINPDLDLEATARVINALLIAAGDALLLPYLNTYYQLYDEAVSQERLLKALFAFIQSGLGARTDA
jgi:TetR/AcrR family transcriptional regulator